MIRLITFLLSGCWHKYKILDCKQVDYDLGFMGGTKTQYILQCERCGNVKTK